MRVASLSTMKSTTAIMNRVAQVQRQTCYPINNKLTLLRHTIKAKEYDNLIGFVHFVLSYNS